MQANFMEQPQKVAPVRPAVNSVAVLSSSSRLELSPATTGYVTVTTPSGMLTSNVPFHVIK